MPKWVVPVNIALTMLIVVAIALIASDLVAHKLGRLIPAPPARTAATPSAPAAPAGDITAFAPILDRGLFGRATQGKLTPITREASAARPAAGPSQNDLVLLGTAVGSSRETFALIQKAGTKEERVFRLGDRVFDIGPLVAVRKEMAEVQSGAARIKLFSPTAAPAEAPKAPVQTAPAPAGPPGSLASQIGAGSYVVDQRALNAALDNIGQAMTDARLLPSVKEGKVEGFRVSEVKPAGVFGMLGIRNGDILLRINDFPIDSPEKAMQSFISLKGQNRVKLDLIRDGQPTTFNYDIR